MNFIRGFIIIIFFSFFIMSGYSLDQYILKGDWVFLSASFINFGLGIFYIGLSLTLK